MGELYRAVTSLSPLPQVDKEAEGMRERGKRRERRGGEGEAER